MRHRWTRGGTVWGLAAWVAIGLTGCDSTSTGIDDDGDGAAVLLGSVDIAAGGGADASGIVVSVDGQTASDTTDASGTFRVEVVAVSSSVTLRFERGLTNTAVTIDGVTPGSLIRVAVTVSDSGATVDSTSSSGLMEFEGEASLTGLTGSAPNRVLSINVTSGSRTTVVHVSESGTAFDSDGDLVTFDALERRVVAGLQVRVEGDGTPNSDGVQASFIKAETDEDDDDDDHDDPGDFDGDVVALSVSTAESGRIMRVQLVDDSTTSTVEIVEGSTSFDPDGDYTTFDAVLAAHDAGHRLEMDGKGTPREDGVIVATEVEVERDD